MYLLTKKIGQKSCFREQILSELLKCDYSKEYILKNKNDIVDLLPRNKAVDLGASLRNMLLILILKARASGLRIIADVHGEGCFETDFAEIYYIFKRIIATAIKFKTVGCYFEIFEKGLKVRLEYNKKTLPKLPQYFTGVIKKGRVSTFYKADFKKVETGESVQLWELMLDRISVIRLAMIDYF